MSENRTSLEHWVRLLEEQQLPAFAQTARMIVGCASNDKQSASELAALILQDVSMTARLLRLANSIYFKRSPQRITTVSRAIMVIGFNGVRDLCLSIAIIDTFLHGPHRERVVAEMARSLHAAVQARDLARLMGEKEPEEIFIAALLRRLGRLAFWCFAGEIDELAAAELQAAMDSTASSLVALEREHLGFKLDDLTTGLNKAWGLSPLLGDLLANRPRTPKRVQLVDTAYEVVEAVEEGFASKALDQAIKQLSKRFGVSPQAVRKRIEANAADARQIIADMGMSELAERIPDPLGRPLADGEQGNKAGSEWPEPDVEVQMAVLRELSDLLEAPRPDFNKLIDLVLEGVYRGVGMDRCVVALVTDKGQHLVVKYSLGKDSDRLESQFDFDLHEQDCLVVKTMAQQRPVWVDPRPDIGGEHALDEKIATISGGAFLLMPLPVDNRSIGCLYADRKPSGRLISADQYSAFRMFGQQIRLALSVLSK